MDSSGLIVCYVLNGCWVFLNSGQDVVEFLRRTLRGVVPALCVNTCALAGACMVNVLLRILLFGTDVFTYRRHGWFSFKLRDLRLEIESRCAEVKHSRVEHLFRMLPGFVCVALVHCKSSACFQCCEEERMQHRGCYAGNPSNDLSFSSKWEVPCAWKVYLVLEAGVFLHEAVFQVITFLSSWTAAWHCYTWKYIVESS